MDFHLLILSPQSNTIKTEVSKVVTCIKKNNINFAKITILLHSRMDFLGNHVTVHSFLLDIINIFLK